MYSKIHLTFALRQTLLVFENSRDNNHKKMPSVFELEFTYYKDAKEKLNITAVDTPQNLLDRSTFHEEWKTDLYLKDFYTKVEDSAMQMVLTFLPVVVQRIGPVKRVIDFGAGPTIHVSVCFRNTADELYLADYLPQNRKALQEWFDEKMDFDWSVPLKIIDTREGGNWSNIKNMEPAARKKVKGIYHCDCFEDPAIKCSEDLQGTFNVLVTIFCVEYCCNTFDEYKASIKNMSRQIALGGYLVMGGVFEETWCSFGGRNFTCLYITQEMMMEAFKEAGLSMENDKACVLYEVNGMYMVVAKKIE
ncbi:unnamed protein product, partial [Mesorhabditis belari]|uniref:Methyltransferase NNMT/PNMT/TEMT n=1 Tax=Mesorhabditis belari TaxID=2138241 RepID=A0AAF3FD12_9BILA